MYVKGQKPGGYWTKKLCFEEAKKYSSRTTMARGSQGAYNKLLQLGLMNQACRHMKKLDKPDGYWTYDRLIKIAAKYTSKSDFRKSIIRSSE